MASKLKYDKLPIGLKRLSKPVISTDIMGNRNIEIRPVGAWVQPVPSDAYAKEPDAIVLAEEEEQRINSVQRAKEKRLRQFHEDVKKRVKTIERLKKQQEMEKNIHDMEQERFIQLHRSVIHYNAGSSGNLPKDSSIVRKDSSHSIKTPSSNKTPKESLKTRKQEELKNQIFTDQTNQIHQFTSEARKKLTGKVQFRRDLVERSPPKPRGALDLTILTRDHRPIQCWDDNSVEDETEDDDEEASDEEHRTKPKKSVHFKISPRPKSGKNQTHKVKNTQVWSSVTVPCINDGVVEEEEKRRKRCQHAMYRKMFMDSEREHVKENIRRKEHQKKIRILKKEKEEERKLEEKQALKMVEPRDPLTGETTAESSLRERLEETHIKETLDEHDRQRQKIKETERYLEALQHNLRHKIEKKGIFLPPLCCCAESAWDTNPETCANNCVFYRNPKAYTKALHSLLVSCDID